MEKSHETLLGERVCLGRVDLSVMGHRADATEHFGAGLYLALVAAGIHMDAHCFQNGNGGAGMTGTSTVAAPTVAFGRCLRVVIWQTETGFALMRVMRGPAFQRIGNFHSTEAAAREAARFVPRKHPEVGFKDMRFSP